MRNELRKPAPGQVRWRPPPRLALLGVALRLAITPVAAQFEGWFNMDGGVQNGFAAVTPSNSPLLIGFPADFSGLWRLEAVGAPANPNPSVEFQRWPIALGVPAQGFTLAAPRNSTGRLWIPADPAQEYLVMFSYVTDFRSLSHLRILDSTGLVESQTGPGMVFGLNVLVHVLPGEPGITFELETGPAGPDSSPEVIQVQGWRQTAPPPPPPRLSVASSASGIVVSWPSPSSGFELQQTYLLTDPAGWTNVPYLISDDGVRKSVLVPRCFDRVFLRLYKP